MAARKDSSKSHKWVALYASEISHVHRVAGVALAVGTAGTLLAARAFSVDTVSAAFIVAGLACSASAV